MRLPAILLSSIFTLLCSCVANPPAMEGPDDTPDLAMSPPTRDLSMQPPADASVPPGTPCKRADDCPGLQMCDHLLNRCVECRVTDDCAADSICQDSHCRPATPCTTDIACKPMGMICDTMAGRCVACNGAGDCQGNDPMRLPKGTACLGHTCIPTRSCMSTLECDGTLVCAPALPPTWPTTFAGKGCSECASNADCPSSMACQGGLCFKVCLKSGRKCGLLSGASCGSCPSMTDTCSDRGNGCLSDDASFFDSNLEGMVLTKDAAFVAFRNMASTIYKFNRSTGMRSLAGLPGSYMNSLAKNSTHLFYGVGNKIYRLPLSGGLPEEVAAFGMSDLCYAVAADDKNAYCYINQSAPSWFGIYQVPIGGGTRVQLSDPARSLTIRSMVSSKDKLFFAADLLPGSAIVYTPLGGGATVKLVNVQPNSDILADDSYVYYSTDSGVFRIAFTGGTPETLASASGFRVSDLADGLLYCQSSKGEVMRLDVKTGKSEALLTDKDPPMQLLRADGQKLFGYSSGILKQFSLL